MKYSKEYVFPKSLSDEEKAEIQVETIHKLTEIIGVEVDNVMAEYVLVMVGNKKKMEQIAHDLIDFIGEEAADEFVAWLSNILPKYEARSAPQSEHNPGSTKSATVSKGKTHTEVIKAESSKKDDDGNDRPRTTAKNDQSTKPRIANTSGSGKSTIRSLNGPTKDVNMQQVLAKRSQRFGRVATDSSVRSKRKAQSQTEPAGQRRSSRVTELLGPPVNVAQAELDARETCDLKKRKKTRSRSWNNGNDGGSVKTQRSHRESRNEDANQRSSQRDGQGETQTDGKDSREGNKTLSKPSYNDKTYGERGQHGRQNRANRHFGHGFQSGPRFHGYPMPYGAPGPGMFYGPGTCPPSMAPFGMGYPMPMPHNQSEDNRRFNEAAPDAQAAALSGPAGANFNAYYPKMRPYQNKKWVNPNSVKKEENTDQVSGNEDGAVTITYKAPQNPYYANQLARPRFQNKKWVRSDADKEKNLSQSLPVTPPPESVQLCSK